jgi:hypothetical protein
VNPQCVPIEAIETRGSAEVAKNLSAKMLGQSASASASRNINSSQVAWLCAAWGGVSVAGGGVVGEEGVAVVGLPCRRTIWPS